MSYSPYSKPTKKYSSRPSAFTVFKNEMPWGDIGKGSLVLIGVVIVCVGLFFAGKGIKHLWKTYSYTTIEIVEQRSNTYTKKWNIVRAYKPAWTEYYYITDSDGTRHRRTRHHSAEYYFEYDGWRHSVSKSTYDMSYTIALQDFQKRTYKREPKYPDYPNKVDTIPYVSEVSVSSVYYK